MDKSTYISLRKSNNFSEIIYQYYLETNSTPIIDKSVFDEVFHNYIISLISLNISDYVTEKDKIVGKIILYYDHKLEVSYIMKVDPKGNQTVIDIY